MLGKVCHLFPAKILPDELLAVPDLSSSETSISFYSMSLPRIKETNVIAGKAQSVI
jgi:hypothetical protein